ncbi:MAG: NADP-dependent phosphogluconate dehydrogenase [Planctomycetes bacterium]|nr:NADP-dependent phosphogluconate dehydrogenase [Planctomycetota bacterium]
MADHGYRVAVYNRTTAVTNEFIEQYSTQYQSSAPSEQGIAPPSPPGRGVGGEGRSGEDPHPSPLPGGEGIREAQNSGGLVGCETLEQFVAAIKPPRVMIVLVKAGPAVDAVCGQLIEAGVQPNDIVVDGGNSLWTDTIRREKEYRGRLTFFGSGVSGGEVGARYGPSLMPGGDERAWERLKPIWESIAAKVDARSGKPQEGVADSNSGGEPCTAYIGPNGAGHYVKMVHNGIEYADMQLIAEAYHLLRTQSQLAPKQIGDIFTQWNEGELASYLIEITADILRQDDPVTGQPLVDVILDKAGMKGTGTWTAINALELGVPSVSITEAVFARGMSGLKDERVAASKVLAGPTETPAPAEKGEGFEEAVRDALYCSKICAYAQGFQLMAAAQSQYDWKLNFGEIARIWRGGCIIRAAFLQKITDAYERDANLANLLLDSFFRGEIAKRQAAWRRVVSHAALSGIPTPAFSSALAYYDAYRTATLPANLIQAQRDYFGAHTYERVDQPRGKFFHLEWTDPNRPQLES